MRVLWHWYSMGPYHFARMGALAQQPGIDLTVIESTSLDDHGWQRENRPALKLVSLSSGLLDRKIVRDTTERFGQVLDEVCPDVVVAPGYADPCTLRKLISYKSARPETRLLLWSETTEADHSRKWLSETVKSRLLAAFDGALVAGTCHARYLRRLGMKSENIEVAGNCVDNGWFAARTQEIRSASTASDHGLPEKYFLFVGRLIRAKNLGFLIDSYNRYRQEKGALAWDLVIAGNGPDEQALRGQAANQPKIHFAGSKQPDDLLPYYAHAKCLVLPSSSEPWGLVVNEAMASGVPVAVSNKCGCAQDLVQHGENGFVFNLSDGRSLVELMLKMSGDSINLGEITLRGAQTIQHFSPDGFAARAAAHFLRLISTGSSGQRGGPKMANAMALIWQQVYWA